jgi:hypothetical protein
MERTGELRVRRQAYQQSDPSSLDVKAQEDTLRKECTELATEVAYILQGRGKRVDIKDVHAAAKRRFGEGQAEMSLQRLRHKKRWLERCKRMKRLV